MNKKIITGMVLVSSLLLSSCNLGQKVSQNASNKIAEKIIESQSGGKIDVDSNNGKVIIKTEDGQSEFSAGSEIKLPDNFPKELILAIDAKIIMSTSSDQGASVTYVTNSSQEEIVTKYKNFFANGWKKTVEVDTGEGKMLSFSKTDQNAMVIIGENNTNDQPGKTLVSLTLATETSE